MSTLAQHIFQDAVSVIGNGIVYNVNNYNPNSITFTIFGTSTSRTILFEGSLDNITFYPINCFNLSTSTLASSTTGKDEIWQIAPEGLNYFRTKISAITGGNITISGVVK
jgi:hypothetical protein